MSTVTYSCVTKEKLQCTVLQLIYSEKDIDHLILKNIPSTEHSWFDIGRLISRINIKHLEIDNAISQHNQNNPSMRSFFKLLSTNNSIKKLTMKNIFFDYTGGEMYTCLRNNTCMEELCIRGAKIGGKRYVCASSICWALVVNKSLRVLDFCDSDVPLDSIICILNYNNVIETINFPNWYYQGILLDSTLEKIYTRLEQNKDRNNLIMINRYLRMEIPWRDRLSKAYRYNGINTDLVNLFCCFNDAYIPVELSSLIVSYLIESTYNL